MNHAINSQSLSPKSGNWYIFLSIAVIFLYSPWAIDPVLHIRYIALAVYTLTGAILLLWYVKKNQKLYFSGLFFFTSWLFYLLCSAPGIILSKDRSGDGIFLWLQLLMPGALTLFFTGIFLTDKLFTSKFLKLFLIMGFVALIFGANQLKTLLLKGSYAHSSLYLVTSLFAHKNIFAEILILIFPLALIASFKLNSNWKYFGFLVALSSFLMILILMSKAVWIAFAISLVLSITVLILFRLISPVRAIQFSVKKIKWYAAFFLVLIIPCMILMTKPQMVDSLSKQWRDVVSPINKANQDRMAIWMKTMNISKDHLWTGYGLGNWKLEILKEGNENLKSENNIVFYQRPHNDYLWIISEQGILALIAYLITFGTIITMGYKLAFYSDSAGSRIFYILLNFSLVSYLVYSFFSFPRERIEHSVLLSFVFAIIIIHYNLQFKPKPFQIPKWLVITLAALFLLTISVGLKRCISEIHLRRAYEQRLIENWPGVADEIDKAYSFIFKMDLVSTPLMYYKGEADFNLKHYDDATTNFQRAEQVSPYHIHVLNNLGTCYEIKGNHALAATYFNKAISLSVYFEDAIFNLSAVYFNQKQYEKALKTFQKIDTNSKDPRYSKFAYALIEQYIRQQISKTNDRILQKYLYSVLDDPDWFFLLFNKSVTNQIDFKKQLMLDIVWAAEKIDNDSISANELKKIDL